MSYSYYYYNNNNVNYTTVIDSQLTYNQAKEYNGHHYYTEQTMHYYPQQQQQQPYMSFDNNGSDTIYPNNGFESYQLPLYSCNDDNNVLQDDNFSIVTASDLYYGNNTSPSLLSAAQLTPYSTPSPQISEFNTLNNNAAITGDAASYYDGSYNNYYTQTDLFAPVQPVTKTTTTAAKRKLTAVTEKRHICPICSHRSKRRHNLVEHMLTHNPHRPKTFLCGHCSRPFARKYDMKRHEKIHTR